MLYFLLIYLVYFFMGTDINTFLGIFLLNYMINDSFDFYSNLDPSNSKHILDMLHDLLQKELKKFLPGGGGGGPEPEFIPYMEHLLDDKREIKSTWMYSAPLELNKEDLEEIALSIDKHNNNLDKPVGVEFKEEKDKLIAKNSFLDQDHHHPYELAGLSLYTKEFFFYYKNWILRDISNYNFLSICKLYYESDNKSLLPEKMESYWKIWHNSQISSTLFRLQVLLDSDRSILNIRASNVYFEANDNLLIIGAGILCKHYVYENMLKFYEANKTISRVVFFTKAWEFYQEALQKYYPFFHHYNWHVKLALLEGSFADITANLNNEIKVENAVKSMPPLNERVLSKLYKPAWYKVPEPDWFREMPWQHPSELKENISVHSIKFRFVFDSKTFFLKEEKPEIKSFMLREYWNISVSCPSKIRQN